MPYHAEVVFTSGYDFLFKSTLGHWTVAEKAVLMLNQKFQTFNFVKITTITAKFQPKNYIVKQNKLRIAFYYLPVLNFSSCQRNLIKTFHIEGMIALIALITKMTLNFSSDLSNGQLQLSKKAKNFRNFRNKSHSILMLH